MDYNEQALYSGVVASNHVDLSGPYYDMLDAAVAGGSPGAESAALGCPGGLHLSVDLAPFGLKLGVYGEPQAWGIRSNAVYAAVQHSYHWWAVDHADPAVLAWATGHAIPYLSGVAKFWQCYLTKTPVADAPDGYRYWSVGDCDGDEGCNLPPQEATNRAFNAHKAAPARCAHNCDPNDPNTQPYARSTTLNQQRRGRLPTSAASSRRCRAWCSRRAASWTPRGPTCLRTSRRRRRQRTAACPSYLRTARAR